MRIVHVPSPIQLNVAGKQWTFAACVEHVVDTAPRFNSTGPGIRMGARIIEAFTEGSAGIGGDVSLRDEDWKSLSEEMESPTGGYHPALCALKPDGTAGAPITVPGRLLLPYIDAVAQAKHAPSV